MVNRAAILEKARAARAVKQAKLPRCPKCDTKLSQNKVEIDNQCYWCSRCERYTKGSGRRIEKPKPERAKVTPVQPCDTPVLPECYRLRPLLGPGMRGYAIKKETHFKPHGKTCEVCGYIWRKGVVETVSRHHIIPRSKDGQGTADNLVRLCKRCHNWAEINVGANSRNAFFQQVNEKYEEYEPPMEVLHEANQEYTDQSHECPLHGNWREWVYGGKQIARQGCICH